MQISKPLTLSPQHRTFVFAFAGLLLFLLQSCTSHQPAYPPEPPPSPQAIYSPQTGPATAIYTDAYKALQAAQYTKSEMLMERALRIEPRNPHYWYTMALVKFRQGLYAQTIQFCLKAGSLAGSQYLLTDLNKKLMEQAQSEMK